MNQNQPQNTQIEAAKAANVACKVKLPDGSQRDAVAGVTTPHDVALGISKSLAKDIVVAKVCERERGKEKEREREERETKKSREGRERRTNGGLDLLLPPRFLQPRPQPPLLKSHFTPPPPPLPRPLLRRLLFLLHSSFPRTKGRRQGLGPRQAPRVLLRPRALQVRLCRGPARLLALLRARAGRGARAVVRRQADYRARGRRGVLLRLPHGRGPLAVRRGLPGPGQGGPADHGRKAAVRARGRLARGGARDVRREQVQGRADRRVPRRVRDHALPLRAHGRPVHGAAPAAHRLPEGGQGDERLVRVLAGRRQEGGAAARLRDHVPREGAARRVRAPPRRGREARPPEGRHGAGPRPLAPAVPRMRVHDACGRARLQRADQVHAGALLGARVRRGGHTQPVQLRLVAHERARGALQGEHVHGRGGEAGEGEMVFFSGLFFFFFLLWSRSRLERQKLIIRTSQNSTTTKTGVWPQADELPGPLPPLRLPRPQLPRPAPPHGRLWRAPPQRVQRRALGPDPRAPLPAGRRAHLLPPRPGRGRGFDVPEDAGRGLRGVRARLLYRAVDEARGVPG